VIIMQISFPSEHPMYCGIDLALSFPALVEGRRVHCAITAAALEDHFRAASPREQDLVDAFARHRPAIERAARCLLEEVKQTPQAEMLAVVREKPVAAFAKARSRAARRFHSVVQRARVPDDRELETGTKAVDGDDFDRAAARMA
jgi:hypothetical protein